MLALTLCAPASAYEYLLSRIDGRDAAPVSCSQDSMRSAVRVLVKAPATGWDGSPIAVVATNVLNGTVMIEYGDRIQCGSQWDGRTLDSRFRAGVGTVLVPRAGDTEAIAVVIDANLTPLVPLLIQHGAPSELQRADTGRFVLRVACFAVIMAMALSALLSFVGMRDIVFVVYALNVGALGVWLAMVSGLWGYPEPWLPLYGKQIWLVIALPIAMVGAAVPMMLKQSGIHRLLPRIDRASFWLSRSLLVLAPIVLFLPLDALRTVSLSTELLFAAICVLATGFLTWALIRGHVRALHTLMSIFPFLVLGLAQVVAPRSILHWRIELLMLACAWFVLVSSLVLTMRLIRLRQQRDDLRTQAQTDGLTGLSNRRAMLGELNSLVRQAQVNMTPLTVAFIDIDHFKAINAKLGHEGGDTVLVAVARAIRESVRESDSVARIGGEEFLLALAGVEPVRARQTVERLFIRIRGIGDALDMPELKVTASAGLTWLGAAPDGIADLLRRADRAMYAAKRAGRDRLVELSPASDYSPFAADGDPDATKVARIR